MTEFIQPVLFGILAIGTLWFGYTKKFFDWDSERNWDSQVHLKHVLIAFALYFFICIFLASSYSMLLRNYFPLMPFIGYAAWLNFLNSISIFLGLGAFLGCLPNQTRQGIILCETVPRNLTQDCKMGLFAWVLSSPLVVFLSTFFEGVITYFFHPDYIPDQLAVHFVKMTFSDPFYFFLTIITIACITPLVEETLFRGFLQSFIRRHLGSKQAILITAICFSLFHYSSEQGLGNIPIVGTLFGLALFLGYLYEKQGSLFASICLHALFNGISILKLYFLGRIPCFF